jgi:hypothetical protein
LLPTSSAPEVATAMAIAPGFVSRMPAEPQRHTVGAWVTRDRKLISRRRSPSWAGAARR